MRKQITLPHRKISVILLVLLLFVVVTYNFITDAALALGSNYCSRIEGLVHHQYYYCILVYRLTS